MQMQIGIYQFPSTPKMLRDFERWLDSSQIDEFLQKRKVGERLHLKRNFNDLSEAARKEEVGKRELRGRFENEIFRPTHALKASKRL